MTEPFCAVEYHLSKGPLRKYRLGGDQLTIISFGNTGYSTSVKNFFREAFLPEGYPDSVSDDYLTYQKWDTLQAFCSSITGTLATHAVLTGIGVGDNKATAVAATITWLLKDGAGMIGRILFTWLQGSDLDCNAKKWRFIADILNDAAIFLELISPLFPTIFLLILCVASVTKAIVGVAGGATRAALTQHQARRNNMADVSAKDGSQVTLVNLSALLVGLLITPMVTNDQQLTWSLFILFTALHLLFNYRAVVCIQMEIFNKRRLHLLMRHYLTTGIVLTPAVVNQQEPIIRGIKCFLCYELGSQLHDVINMESSTAMSQLINKTESLYLFKLSTRHRKVSIALHIHAAPIDQLYACVQAEILQFIITHRRSDDWNNKVFGTHAATLSSVIDRQRHLQTVRAGGMDRMAEEELVRISEKIVKDINLLDQLERVGWVTKRNLLGPTKWRYDLSYNKFP